MTRREVTAITVESACLSRTTASEARREAWQIDHSNPVSRGGSDHLNNLWAACIDCNLDKSDRTGKSYKQSMTRQKSSGCFIATAAYGTPYAKEIDVLRTFRDRILMRNTIGRKFTHAYYHASPPIADLVRKNIRLRIAVRAMLKILIWMVKKL